MRNKVRLILLAAAVALSGCSGLSVESDFDRSASFAAYQTFSWISPNPLLSAPDTASPHAQERIQRAIASTLAGKGLRFVADPDLADFVVAFTVGARDPARVDSTLESVGLTGSARWAFRYYSDIDVQQYPAGRLAIDVFDAQSRRPVWHGYATKSLTSADRGNPEALIQRAVDAILESFPPRS